MGGFAEETGTSTSDEVGGAAATVVELFTGEGTKVKTPTHMIIAAQLVGIGVRYIYIT